MDRLTEMHPDGYGVLLPYKDPCHAITKLAQYEDAEEQGRRVVLPCKTGDTVYQIRKKKHANGQGVNPRIISMIGTWSNGNYVLYHQGQTPCWKSDLEKTWFLTREEAEAALAAKKEHCDE